jgi:hypothetical protein
MVDRGYYNFYTPDEYECYQQYPFENYEETSYYYHPEPYRTPSLEENRLENTLIKFMEMQQQQMQQQQQQMQQMQEQHQQYLKNSLARSKNLEIQVGQLAKQVADMQGGTFTTTTQTNSDEQNVVNNSNEEGGESVESVEKHEEERMSDRCGVVKIVEEIETSHEVGLPQEIPCIENGNTVDKEEVMMDTKAIEGIFNKEILFEQKREMENKAEIDRVIDEICALLNNKQLGRTWIPNHLYFKFMEFLPNRRKKTHDVRSISFWPS